MKIRHLIVESKKLMEGGNLSIGSHEAQHLDLKVTNRNYMVPKLNELLNSINVAYAKMYKQPLWSPELLASGNFLSGSSLHFFNVKGISDDDFIKKKPKVGDIDTMVDKEKEPSLQEFLQKYTDKKLGPSIFLGFQRGNEQFSGLFELQDPPVKVQIDFEFVKFSDGAPTDWARFSHSSSWDDLQQGIKGVFHKWLIQSLTALTNREFYLRKMVGRGKLRKEEDILTTDNMLSFAVASKEGGGLRAKYEPVIDPETGKPLTKDGLPVMKALPAEGYEQDITNIFSRIFGKKIDPKVLQQTWSFSGLLQLMNAFLSPEQKQLVLQGFLEKTIGPGAQGMYKNDPDRDLQEKSVAINYMLKTLGLKAPAVLNKMMKDYRTAYKMTGTDEGVQDKKDTVKDMAKRTLDEAAPNYKRQGIQHIYNPGSTVEMKDLDFINFCKEIAADGGKFEGVPINLKVDGAGVRFGRDAQGKPFFMTSRVDTPLYIDNYGDFESYGRRNGQEGERLAFTKNYDEALKTILTSDFMKDVPPDTIVQAEMLFNPMAKQTEQGYEFVNIPYDPAKLGSVMTLVPISVKEFSTGKPKENAAKIKKQLIKDSTKEVKLISNTLPHKGINVSKIVNPIVKNEQALAQAVSTRGNTPEKQKAKIILSKARQALSNAIISSKIPGMDQLGDTIEGLVINMPSGTLAKVTSPDMQAKMAAKLAANKKPTTGSNRVKPAVVTIGSFAGHKGHQQLIQQTIDTAKSIGGDPYIYVSPVMGPDDPLPADVKLQTLRKLYPEYARNIQVWDPRGNPVKKIEKELVLPPNSPYNKVVLLVGDDRYAGFKNWMDSLEKRMKDPVALAKYGGTQNQVDFDTVRTERDPSKGGTGISFTQLRNVLKDPNKSPEEQFQFWSQAFDTSKLGAQWVKSLMDLTRKNMGMAQDTIKEYIRRIKPMLETATPAQKKKIYEQLARLREFAIDKGEDDGRSKLIGTIVRLLKSGKKVDFFVPGIRGHVVGADSGGEWLRLKRWQKPYSKINYSLPLDSSDDNRFVLKMIKPDYYQVVEPQSLNESLLDYSKRQMLIQYLAQKMNWEKSYLELATDHELIKWYKAVRDGKKPMGEQQLDEFAPSDSGDSGQEDMFFKYAKMWYNGNLKVQQRVEEILAQAGWEIGELESEEGGAFIVQSGDEDGKTYMGWSAEDLGGQLNEFAPGNGDDGLPYAEYQVYQCNPLDQFDWIGGPLYQTDSMGMAHKYAYEQYVKHRPKAFMIWQERSQGSRGNYGVKGESDDEINEDNELLNPKDPESLEILKYAQRHYPDAPNAQQAFMKYVLHALKHSEEDDNKQDNEIDHLEKEVDDIEHKLNVSESADYLDEK